MPQTKLEPVDANTLAWWAEEAHGRQGVSLYVYEGDNGKLTITDNVPVGKEALFEITARAERTMLLPAHKISIQVEKGGEERNLLDDPKLPYCDALFWTASSIEKFLFPYYLSQRLYSQAELCGKMALYRNDPTLVAAGHRAPSKDAMIRAGEAIGFFRTTDGRGRLEWVGLKDYS
jgi:hypothetical protein